MELHLELWEDLEEGSVSPGPIASITLQLKKLSWTSALLLLSHAFSEFVVANEPEEPSAPASQEEAESEPEGEDASVFGPTQLGLQELTKPALTQAQKSILDLIDAVKANPGGLLPVSAFNAAPSLLGTFSVSPMMPSAKLDSLSDGKPEVPCADPEEEGEPKLFLYRVIGSSSIYSTTMDVTKQVELVDCVKAQLGCTNAIAWARIKMKEPLSGLLTENEVTKFHKELLALGLPNLVEAAMIAADATFSLSALPPLEKWGLLAEDDVTDILAACGLKGALGQDLRGMFDAVTAKMVKVAVVGIPRAEITKILMLRYMLNQRGCRTLLETE